MTSVQPAGGPAVAHHTARVNGVRLHYVTAGAGDPVVLLHGWPQTWYEWRRVIPLLAEKYTVVAPDLRGFGDSDKPAGGYDKRTVAEDVYQLVQHLKLGPVNLVGHDIGMMVAYAYAAAHPDGVRRLVLAEAVLPGVALDEVFDTGKYPELWHFGFFRAPNVAEALITGRELPFISYFVRQQCYDPAAVTDADVGEYARRMAAPGALRASFEHYRAFPLDAEHNRELARTPLAMPVLAMGGAAGLGDKLEAALRPLARQVRGVVMDRCGHYFPEERPDATAEELARFFSGEA